MRVRTPMAWHRRGGRCVAVGGCALSGRCGSMFSGQDDCAVRTRSATGTGTITALSPGHQGRGPAAPGNRPRLCARCCHRECSAAARKTPACRGKIRTPARAAPSPRSPAPTLRTAAPAATSWRATSAAIRNPGCRARPAAKARRLGSSYVQALEILGVRSPLHRQVSDRRPVACPRCIVCAQTTTLDRTKGWPVLDAG